MLRFGLSPNDLLHSRFALSPSTELTCLLRRLRHGSGEVTKAWLQPKQAVFDRLVRETDLGAVLGLASVTGGVSPGLIAHTDDAWPKALVYSARGIASLWDDRGGKDRNALADLLGSTRAAILLALDVPASTSQLVHVMGMTLGAASRHLAILHSAELVVKARRGRSVLYSRTPLGDSLARVGRS